MPVACMRPLQNESKPVFFVFSGSELFSARFRAEKSFKLQSHCFWRFCQFHFFHPEFFFKNRGNLKMSFLKSGNYRQPRFFPYGGLLASLQRPLVVSLKQRWPITWLNTIVRSTSPGSIRGTAVVFHAGLPEGFCRHAMDRHAMYSRTFEVPVSCSLIRYEF